MLVLPLEEDPLLPALRESRITTFYIGSMGRWHENDLVGARKEGRCIIVVEFCVHWMKDHWHHHAHTQTRSAKKVLEELALRHAYHQS